MERPVRILYIINALEVGGTEGQLVELVNGLDKNKVFPHLCCLGTEEGKAHYKIDCPVISLGLEKVGSIRSLIGMIRLIHYLNKESIDIVQTFFIEGTLFGVIAGKLAKKVSVILVSKRDLGFMVTTRVLKRLKLVYRYVDRFLANSKSVKEYLVEREGVDVTRIDVIYNGIDMEALKRKIRGIPKEEIRRRERIPENASIVGICANLNRAVKRVDLFLEAAARICRDRNNVFFLIIGEGGLKREMMELADRLGINERTRFVGSQTNPVPYISTFTVGVISSDSEGFSNSIMEYMCCGVPVVATNVGGNPELVMDGVTGMLVPSGDADEVADAIQTLLDHPDFRKRASEESRRILYEKFTKGKMIHAHEAYYAALIQGKRKNLEKGASCSI